METKGKVPTAFLEKSIQKVGYSNTIHSFTKSVYGKFDISKRNGVMFFTLYKVTTCVRIDGRIRKAGVNISNPVLRWYIKNILNRQLDPFIRLGIFTREAAREYSNTYS